MTFKEKILLTAGSLTGLVGTALAKTSDSARNYTSYTPDVENGNKILSEIPYVDKLMDIIDVIYAIVPWVAIGALGYLGIAYYMGGWDSVENEIRTRKKFFVIIIIILALKVGSALVGMISNW